MAKLKLDLHHIFNKGDQIEQALHDIMERANEKNAKTVEIIHGKGSGQLKKKVLRFLQQPHIREQYQRVVKDPKNSGRLFIYFKK
jgi:DNA-nicking Smr family endonuclease